MTVRCLVVGYGNALRGDDGIGWHAAGLLAEDPRLAGTTVLQCHQLMPELAADIGGASLVVLMDADQRLPAGEVSVTSVARTNTAVTGWSHHCSPSDLVGLAHELYEASPEVLLVSVGAASTEVGDQLSPVVEAALPQLLDTVTDLISGALEASGVRTARLVKHA